jgi:hypothetical protein
MPEKEKVEAEQQLEAERKERPFWEKVPPLVIIAAVVIIFLALKSATMEDKGNYIWYIIIVLIIMFLLSKQGDPKVIVLSPRDADICIEREAERRLRWQQKEFRGMVKCEITGLSDLKHTDARGVFYDCGILLTGPDQLPRYLIAKVMARGDEIGFVMFQKAIGEFTGRKVDQEKSIVKVPDWIKHSKDYSILEKIWVKEKRE